ncbi:MAG TPA: ATP-dependent DNA helicase RecQ [Melioribacteraceae bacterium]|nr:ATP-dependent DNA helicase RecQ [Melioribacteraceae bacterium]
MTPYEVLKNFFGYSSFRDNQEEIIDTILQNKNILAILPTGAGKSLCYQIPALCKDGLSIVISPLIALMKDQVDALNKTKTVAAFINSTLEYKEIEKIFNDIYSGNIKLLYLAPERLENSIFVERLSKLSLEYLFIDEAHCISEWGHNFRPSYKKIRDFKDYINFKGISAFTATATPKIRVDIINQLGLSNPSIFIAGFERDNLVLNVIRTNQKKFKTLELVKKYNSTTIIYAATRKNVEEISQFLRFNGIKSEFYHAGLESNLRKMIQDDFIKGNIDVICATTAFGMGIDKNNVRLVIHYNMSSSIENYYQEIGRAGRDGKESYIYLLYDKNEKETIEFIQLNSFPNREQIITIYNAICNYGRVAIGMKSDNGIPLNKDFYKILNSADFNINLIHSIISILVKAGYFKLYDNYQAKHLIKFLLNINDLRIYIDKIANNKLKDTILLLLREYGSNLFINNLKIDLNKLSNKYNVPFDDIEDSLKKLNAIGIVEYTPPVLSTVVYMETPRVDSKLLKLDFSDLDAQKAETLSKINEMVNYVYSDKCRFNFILEYFGQNNIDYRCGKCDNCKGDLGFNTSTIEFLEEVILKSVHESYQRMRIRNLYSVLTGNTKSDRFKNLTTFGTCAHFSRNEIDSSLNSLLDKCLLKNVNNVLVLTEKGIELFLQYNENNNKVGKKEVENYELNVELFTRLKDIRKVVASRYSQTPSLVCPDEILRNISLEKPKSPEHLLNIDGFNQRMFNKLGAEILDAINDFIKEKQLNKTEPDYEVITKLPENIIGTYKLLKRGYSLGKIADMLKTHESIVALQIESIIEFDPNTNIDTILLPSDFKKIEILYNSGLKEVSELKIKNNNLSIAQIRIAVTKLKYFEKK